MILLLVAAAFAEPCAPAMATALVPAPGAVDVPVDVVLAAGIDTGCGLAAETWAFELYQGEALVHEASVSFEGGHRLSTAPAEPLAAHTAYVLRVFPEDGSGQFTEAAFTTGEQPAVALSGAPSIRSIDGIWYEANGFLSIGVSITAAPHPPELTMVGFARAPGAPPLAAAASGTLFASVDMPGAPEEICGIPLQWGADGARVEGAEVCGPVTVDEASRARCDASGLAPAAFPALLALLAIRRRRA